MLNCRRVKRIACNVVLDDNNWLIEGEAQAKLQHYIRVFPTNIHNHDRIFIEILNNSLVDDAYIISSTYEVCLVPSRLNGVR